MNDTKNAAPETPLGKEIMAYLHDHPEHSGTLLPLVEAMEEAASGADAKRIVGTWAKCRRVYCELTGKSLI